MQEAPPALAGLLAAVSALPSGIPDLQQGGFAVLVGFLIWWITQNLSKKMDDHSEKVEHLAESIIRLAESIEKDRK